MYRILITILTILFVWACDGNGNSEEISSRKLKEPLIEANKTRAEIEDERIDKYVRRMEWEMLKTGTGLRYMIYEEGKGIQAKKGDYATVHYEIKLLDGTLCYSSFLKGPKTFLIGRDHVESGVHEGVTYMHVGDKGKFILPSNLAHGLTGDNNKIPPMSTLVIDMELLSLR